MKSAFSRALGALVLLSTAVPLLAQSSSSSPGYDVVLLIGQSNMVGVGTGTDDQGDAAVDARIFQWQPYTNSIIPALDPIYQNQGLDNIGLPMTFAKAYAKRMAPGRKLLLVGAATGSTGFVNGYWVTPNGDSGVTSPGPGVTTALSWYTAAWNAAGANANLVGILWHQGETDMYGSGGASYATDLTNLISYLRTNMAGATGTTPFVVGENCYAYLTSILTQSYAAQQIPILNADHNLPDTVPYTAWTSAAELPADATYGPAHFSALSYRQLGRRYADKLFEAANNLPQPQASQKWWGGSFYDDGRGLGLANTNSIPVNNPPTVNGTVTAAIDPVHGNVAKISQGQGSLTFQVPGTTFNASYSKMAWFLPGAAGYTNNLVSASASGQTHFLSAQTLSTTSLLIAAGHSSGSLSPIVQKTVANTAGTWINAAVTYDSVAKVMTLYVNGAAVATAGNVAAAPGITSATESLLMGGIGANGATGLDGEMAGNRVWTSALTAAQITAIYNFELAGTANEPGFGIIAGFPSQWSLDNAAYFTPPISIAAASGSTASEQITVVPNNGFTGSVNFAVSGLPAGLSATFAAGATANSFTLKLSATSSVTPGTYPLAITGTAANNVSAQAALALTVVNITGETPVNLSSYFNHSDTFVTDGSAFSAGSLDGAGYAFSANLIGSTLTTPNGQFTLGSPNTANSVANATIGLPSGNYSSVALLGTATGNQTAQTFTVTYSDGSTSAFTQSASNWCSPQFYAGESVALAMPYRNYSNGTEQSLNCFLYSYAFPLNSAKIAKSITLPNNGGVLILAVTVTGAASASPSFTLSSSPSSLTVIPGNAASSTIAVSALNGFSGMVSVSPSGLPSGVTASAAAGTVSGTTVLTLTAGPAAATGTYTVTVTGTSGSLSASTAIALTVTAPNVAPVSVTSANNVYGIFTDGANVTNGGLDGANYAYSANLLGSALVFQNIPYSLGTPGTANAASSTTLTLPAGNYAALNFLGTAIFGNQAAQTFTVTYTDGTSTSFTQGLSDWGSPQAYSGESVALKMAYRDTQAGGQQSGPWNLYAYSFALNSAKGVKSLTLPNSRNVVVLAVTLSGQTGTAAQTITFKTIATQTVGTQLALTATASSGLAVSYASSTASVCTVSGSTASFAAAGTCTIIASQAGNASYAAATPVSNSFTVQAAAISSTTAVSLTAAANIYGFFNDGSTVSNGGLDGANYAYSAKQLGTSLGFQGVSYSFGSAGMANAVSAVTLTLPAGSYSTLSFLGTAVFGNQANQVFTVTYTDGTTTTLTQSLSDWGYTQSYSGETIALQMPYRLTQAGAQQNGPWNLYAYSISLNAAKTVKSLTLPNSRNVVVLAVTLQAGAANTQSITFNAVPAQTVNTSLPLTSATATASSGLAVTYSSATTSVCTVSGATALFLSAGTCTLSASQAGNATYAAATPASQSFTVNAASAVFTTICQAQPNGTGSFCSNRAPGPASGGYNSLPSWVNLGKTLSSITVADDQVWGLDASGNLWYLADFKAATLSWTQVATGVTQISAGHNLICQINSNKHLLCGLPGASVTWIDAGVTSYTQVAVSAGTKLWAVDSSNNLSLVADYNHASTTTTLVAPTVQSVAADGRGLVCQTDLSNNVYCSGWPVLPAAATSGAYHNLSNWVNTGKQLQNIAVADNKVYGTDSSGNVWLLPDYTNSGTWEQIAYGGTNDKIAAASVPSSFQPAAFSSNDVAVMIFMGQSNATGIGSFPSRFVAPSSPNVWSVTNQGWNYLAGNNNGTTPFTSPISSINAIGWSNFLVSPTTFSDMNLGFNTSADGNAANYAAYQWQAMINAGAQLPDLYVIHVGWASQGVDANDGGPSSIAAWTANGTSLWQPLLTNTQQPAYALAPFSRRILNLALNKLVAAGKTPRIIGLQWNQWEAEAGIPVAISDAPTNYANLFNGFYGAIGSHFPVQIVKPLSTAYGAASLSAMQTVFAGMASSDAADFSLLDVSQVSSTIFSGGVLGSGDGSVHYNLDTQQWFGNQAINACLVQGKCGTRITSVTGAPTN